MKKKQKNENHFSYRVGLLAIKLLNAIAMTVPFGVCWYLFFANSIAAPYYRRGNYVVILIYFVVYIYLGRVNNAFFMSYYRVMGMVYNQMITAVLTNGVGFVITWLLRKHLPNLGVFIIILASQFAIAVLWSLIARFWYYHTFPSKKTAIIWDMRQGLDKLINSYGLSQKYNVVRSPSAQECISNIDMLNDVEVAFLTGVHSRERNIIIKHCVSHDITAYIIPRIGDTLMSAAHPMHMFHLPFLELHRYSPSPEYLIIKRLMDIILSIIALVILSPLMLVVGLMIHFQDGGTAFYKQTRLTKNGRKFDVIKFRSMRMDAEKDGVARLSPKNDDRITPVGKFVRATRIDELPQLINVLKGDMSIVGPRPERPEIHEQYCEKMPEFDLRLQAKAGVTGYAQIYGKYNTTPYDKLQMDLMYLARPSIVQDINIFLTTIKVLFMPESTEGIDEGTTVAGESDDSSIR